MTGKNVIKKVFNDKVLIASFLDYLGLDLWFFGEFLYNYAKVI